MNNTINFNLDFLIDEYANYVFKIVDNIGGKALTYQDKEEIVSDVFYLLWKNQDKIDSNLKAYFIFQKKMEINGDLGYQQ